MTFCFRSNIQEPVANDVVFGLFESNDTTSRNGAEFFPNVTVPDVIIPLGFSGMFTQCIDIVIVNDNVVEETEVIVYNVEPFSERNVVRFPENSESLVISVQDDDGKIK